MDSKTPFDDDYEPKEELEAERSSDDEPSRTSGTDERLLAPVDLLASDFFQVIDPQSTGNSTYFQPEKSSPMHPPSEIVEPEPGHQPEKGLDEVDLLGVPLHLSETSPTLPSDVDHQSSLQRPEEPDDASRLHLELNKIEVAHRDLDSSGSSAQKQVSDSSETPDSRRNIIAEESEVSFLGEATEGFNKESIDDSAMDMSGIGMSSPQRFDSESIIGSTVVPDLKHDWRKQLEPIAQFPLNQGHISEENSHQDDASQLLPSDDHQNIRQNTQEDSVSKHDFYNQAEASFQNADNSVQGADLIEGEVRQETDAANTSGSQRPPENIQQSDQSFIARPPEAKPYSEFMSDVPGFVTWITSLRIEVEGPYLEGPSSSTFSKLYCYYIVVFDGEQIYSRAIRRYNDFQWTERALEFEFLGRVIPCTPEKNPLVKAGLANEGFFEDRRQKLEHFVRAIVCLPEVNISKTVFSFMFSSRQEFGLFQEEHSKTLVDVSEKASTSIMGYFETFWAKSDKFKSWNPELAEMVAKRQAELMNFKMAFQGYYKNTEELLNSEQIYETGIAEEETTGWQEANKTQEAMRKIHLKAQDLVKVFERLALYMEFVEEASKRVDRERLDQFSNATVLSKRLDVVKKKVEGFDKNLDRDFPGMMQELYGLFRQLFVQNRVGKC